MHNGILLALMMTVIGIHSKKPKKSRFEFWPRMKKDEVCMDQYHYKIIWAI